MIAAGMLDNKARFEKRAPGSDDGYGNVLPSNTWTAVATRWVSFRPELGRETKEAGRLESTMRGIVRVRRDNTTETITPDCRIAFTVGHYTGRTAQIRSIVPMMDGADFEMSVEFGVAE
jgi:head-tail adaptor